MSLRDPAAEAEILALQEAVTEVRRFRSDQGLNVGQRVPGRLTAAGFAGRARGRDLRSLAQLTEPADGFAATATLQTALATVELDLSGTIDVAAERARLTKDQAAAAKEIAAGEREAGQRGVPGEGPGAGRGQDPHPAGDGRGGSRPDPDPAREAPAGLTYEDRQERSATVRLNPGE